MEAVRPPTGVCGIFFSCKQNPSVMSLEKKGAAHGENTADFLLAAEHFPCGNGIGMDIWETIR